MVPGCEKVQKPRNGAGAANDRHCQKSLVTWDDLSTLDPAVLMGPATERGRGVSESEF